MQRTLQSLFATVLVATLLPAATADQTLEKHDITLDDYLSVYLITGCETSPDGQHVAFTELRWWDADEPRSTDLWVVNTETGKSTRLTFDRVSDRTPQWAPDNLHLYFITQRDRGDKNPPYDNSRQVWVMTPHPGEPFPITQVTGGINAFELSKDGRTLYYTVDGPEKHTAGFSKLRGKYADVRYNNGPVHYTQLWKLDLETWRAEKLVDEERVITHFAVAPDESRIAMLTNPDERAITGEGWSRVDIYDAESGAVTTLPDELFREQAPSPYGWLGDPAWSSDSTRLAWTVYFDGYPVEIIVAEWSGAAPQLNRLKRSGDYTVAGALHWLPDTHDLCFLAEDHARRRVYCIGQAGGSSQGALRVLTPGDVVVHDFSFDADGQRIAVVRSGTRSCRDVWWGDAQRPGLGWEPLTNINPQIETWNLPQISLMQWQAPDGTTVEGILELPPDYKEGDGPLPTVIELHGGPTACTLYHMRYWIYGRTIFAAKGYALLSPNYRGSTGYGDKFMTDLIGRENDVDVKDILAGVDALVERGIADPDRIGVMGWSNGGFLTNCLITTTDRFKAASTGAGVVHQMTQWGLGATPGHSTNYMRGLPWEQPEAYAKASPFLKLGNVTTPTLIHTGDSDPNVVPQNSYMLYRALSDYTDVETMLLSWPKAGHGLVVSDHRKGKLEWDLAWFAKYVLGEDDSDE
jgi:dipeptidyl aminopeptidase/acylaminoacyl peptidase